jgi:hypothetical protein
LIVGGNYRFNTSLETYERDGVEYVRYNKPNMIYTIKRAYFKMDNLLGIKEGETGEQIGLFEVVGFKKNKNCRNRR